MKKIISLLLVLVMMLGLVACGAKAPVADAPAADAPAADAPAADAPAADAPAADEPAADEGIVVDTMILKEADDKMLNTYSAIAVNPEAPFELSLGIARVRPLTGFCPIATGQKSFSLELGSTGSDGKPICFAVS